MVSWCWATGALREPRGRGCGGEPWAWLRVGAPWNMVEVPLINSGFGEMTHVLATVHWDVYSIMGSLA